jgi:hypothetical protein
VLDLHAGRRHGGDDLAEGPLPFHCPASRERVVDVVAAEGREPDRACRLAGELGEVAFGLAQLRGDALAGSGQQPSSAWARWARWARCWLVRWQADGQGGGVVPVDDPPWCGHQVALKGREPLLVQRRPVPVLVQAVQVHRGDPNQAAERTGQVGLPASAQPMIAIRSAGHGLAFGAWTRAV